MVQIHLGSEFDGNWVPKALDRGRAVGGEAPDRKATPPSLGPPVALRKRGAAESQGYRRTPKGEGRHACAARREDWLKSSFLWSKHEVF